MGKEIILIGKILMMDWTKEGKMRVVWEFCIEQKFQGRRVEFYIERYIGYSDLWLTLSKRIPIWRKEISKPEGNPCVGVKVISAKKICDLT